MTFLQGPNAVEVKNMDATKDDLFYDLRKTDSGGGSAVTMSLR